MRYALLCLCCLGLFLSACSPQKEKPPVRPVLTQVISPSSALHSAHYVGLVHARYATPLSFRVPGKITQRLVGLGDKVKAGQLLATIDSRDLQLAAEAATATMQAAKQQHQLAQQEFARTEKLALRNLVSQSAYDQQKAQLEVAKAKLDQARKQLKVKQNRLTYSKLKANHAGTIAQVKASIGQVVSAGQPVFRFARAGEKEMWLTVPGSQINHIDVGDNTVVRLWAKPTLKIRGKVRQIASAANPTTGTYQVRITLIDAPDFAQLGMTGAAFFHSPTTSPSIRLPLTALYHQKNKPAVWRVDKSNRVHLIRVQVQAYQNNSVILAATDKLHKGDTIVTRGVSLLTAGQKVKPLSSSLSDSNQKDAH